MHPLHPDVVLERGAEFIGLGDEIAHPVVVVEGDGVDRDAIGLVDGLPRSLPLIVVQVLRLEDALVKQLKQPSGVVVDQFPIGEGDRGYCRR